METPKPLDALIFANGDVHDGPMVQHVLAEMRSAWVIAADGGAHHAQALGFRVDTLIGDMDSLNAGEVEALNAGGAKIHRYPAAKNETDLELALLHAADAGVQRIRIIAAVGNRLDQTLGNVYLLALPVLRSLDIRIIAWNQESWLLFPGEALIRGLPGDTISLIPVSGEVQGVRTENLYYPLRDEPLVFGPARGMSNVMTADTARVWLSTGTLLLVHTLGRA